MPWRDAPLISPTTGREIPQITVTYAGDEEPGGEAWRSAPMVKEADQYDRSAFGVAGAIPRGINTGLASVAGAPVDLLNVVGSWGPMAINAIFGTDFQHVPLPGGSEDVRQAIDTGVGTVSRALGGSGTRATYDDISQLPPEERIGAVAGEVIGMAAPLAAAPLAAAGTWARSGVAQAGNRLGAEGAAVAARAASVPTRMGPAALTQPIVSQAALRPGTFAAAEAGAIAGAAQGAAAMEALFPGNETARMVGEMGGAIVNPASLVARVARGGAQSARNFFSGFTPSGVERRAADYIVKAFAQTGEDPAAALSALRAAQNMGVNLTVGQRTGSPTLLAVESQLSRLSPQFAAERNVLEREGMEALRQSIDRVTALGTAEALAQAAMMRGRYFNEVMTARIAAAQQEAQEAVVRLAPEGQAARSRASREAYDALDGAIQDARKIESELWGEVPKDVRVSGDNLMEEVGAARARMLPDAKLNSDIEGMIARVARGDELTSGQYLTLRSELLTLARNARSGTDPNRNLAAIYDNLAGAVLRDLDTIPGQQAEIAREFSRSMHDAFSKTFAGSALGSSQTGGMRIEPELMLDRAFGAGGPRGEVQMRQLQEAAAFSGPERAQSMQTAQSDYMRGVAARAINPEAGQVNAGQLARFQAANEGTIAGLPGVGDDISRAVASQRALESVQRGSSFASRVLGKSSPLGSLLRGETPVTAVRNAFSSGDRSFVALANMARGAGPDALEGLGAASLSHFMSEARTASGAFDFDRFASLLTTPGRRGTKTPLQLMLDNGALTQEQANNLTEIITRASTLKASGQQGRELADLIESPDALTDMLVRLVGASAGSRAAVAGAHPLLASSAGVRTAQNLFAKAPKVRIQHALIKLVQDPELMAEALRRTPTPESKLAITRQLNAAFISAGIDLDLDLPEEPQPGGAHGDLVFNPESVVDTRVLDGRTYYQDADGNWWEED